MYFVDNIFNFSRIFNYRIPYIWTGVYYHLLWLFLRNGFVSVLRLLNHFWLLFPGIFSLCRNFFQHPIHSYSTLPVCQQIEHYYLQQPLSCIQLPEIHLIHRYCFLFKFSTITIFFNPLIRIQTKFIAIMTIAWRTNIFNSFLKIISIC